MTETSNVRVVARIRPLSTRERRHKFKEAVTSMKKYSPNEPGVIRVLSNDATKNRVSSYCFTFDKVFGKDSTQEDVYDHSGIRNAICRDVFEGYNTTILAYGQTGTGKTYSMGTASIAYGAKDPSGEILDEEHQVNDNDGIIPRACYDLFETIRDKCRGAATVELQYLEIYNEDVRDLLTSENNKRKLVLRDAIDGNGVKIIGLTSAVVKSPNDVAILMKDASKNRTFASTVLNAWSSRSHAICTLKVTGIAELKSQKSKFTSTISFVDLAGSERIKKMTDKLGGVTNSKQAKEGIHINKGLFVLGQVISTLAEQGRRKNFSGSLKKKPPFRDSKLTRILQGSLGGNSRTIMLACVSCSDYSISESINTLKYANSARDIKSSVKPNVTTHPLTSTKTPTERVGKRSRKASAKLKNPSCSSSGNQSVEVQPSISLKDAKSQLNGKSGRRKIDVFRVNSEALQLENESLKGQIEKLEAKISTLSTMLASATSIKATSPSTKGHQNYLTSSRSDMSSVSALTFTAPTVSTSLDSLTKQEAYDAEPFRNQTKVEKRLSSNSCSRQEGDSSSAIASAGQDVSFCDSRNNKSFNKRARDSLRRSLLLEQIEELQLENKIEKKKAELEYLKKEEAWILFVETLLDKRKEQVVALSEDFELILKVLDNPESILKILIEMGMKRTNGRSNGYSQALEQLKPHVGKPGKVDPEFVNELMRDYAKYFQQRMEDTMDDLVQESVSLKQMRDVLRDESATIQEELLKNYDIDAGGDI